MKGVCMRGLQFLLIMSFLLMGETVRADEGKRLSESEFVELMQKLADGWNGNDAKRAASVFAPNAVYSEPPDKQLYQGRQDIYVFFGGADGRDEWMRMTWHHLSFNEAEQVGAGEYTFEWPEAQVHGMVSVKIQNGLILNWREYFYESELAWEQFRGKNRF